AKPAPAAPATAAPGAPAAPAAEPPPDPDKFPAVVARVNGQEIKKEDLVKEVKGIQARMAQQGPPAHALPANPYRQRLEAMIARTLLEADAKTQGATATDDEVKKQLDQAKSQFPNADDCKNALAKEGITEPQLAGLLKQNLTIQKYIDAKVA